MSLFSLSVTASNCRSNVYIILPVSANEAKARSLIKRGHVFILQFKAPCKRTQPCWMLHVAFVCTPCCMLLDVVAESLKPIKLFSQQLPTFLLFGDRRSVVQHCWIRLQSSSNIVGAKHANYTWFTLVGCILPTMHCRSQHCWEWLRPFARGLNL